MKTVAKTCTAMALAAVLGGCQSGGLAGWSLKSSQSPVLEKRTVDYAVVLEEGRAQLKTGNLSAAAASFRIAANSAGEAAESYNGLAIVYARIGRADLADRYFRAALGVEPDSQRFAANLLRLQGRVLAARQSQELRTAASIPPPVMASETPRGRSAPGKIERVARGVVRITTPLELGSAPRIGVVYRQQAGADRSSEDASEAAQAPVELAAVIDKSKTYPVRISLDP